MDYLRICKVPLYTCEQIISSSILVSESIIRYLISEDCDEKIKNQFQQHLDAIKVTFEEMGRNQRRNQGLQELQLQLREEDVRFINIFLTSEGGSSDTDIEMTFNLCNAYFLPKQVNSVVLIRFLAFFLNMCAATIAFRYSKFKEDLESVDDCFSVIDEMKNEIIEIISTTHAQDYQRKFYLKTINFRHDLEPPLHVSSGMGKHLLLT